MRKKILIAFMTVLFSVISARSQVPYFGKAPGDSNLYGYTSMKMRPGINAFESYTTFQYGITDYFAAGTDVYTGSNQAYWGFLFRAGYKFNKWYSLGGTATPSFDLSDNFKFSYFTGGVFMNGAITQDEKLFWCTNTWFVANRDGTNSANQFSHLGYAFPLKKGDSITPMVALEHSWKFDSDPDMAAGFYYTHGIWNFYAWGGDFFKEGVKPRLIVGVDFKLPTKF